MVNELLPKVLQAMRQRGIRSREDVINAIRADRGNDPTNLNSGILLALMIAVIELPEREFQQAMTRGEAVAI